MDSTSLMSEDLFPQITVVRVSYKPRTSAVRIRITRDANMYTSPDIRYALGGDAGGRGGRGQGEEKGEEGEERDRRGGE